MISKIKYGNVWFTSIDEVFDFFYKKEKQLQQIELKKQNKEQKELAKLEKLKSKTPVGRPKKHKLNG